MNTQLKLAAITLACLVGQIGSACAQSSSQGPIGALLSSAAARISDAVISADQRVYEGLQSRIKGINDRGRPVRDYHLSKAQCWLDVSFHEYTRNDRGPFPQAAMAQAEQLIVGMEADTRQLSMETLLVGEAVKLRDDLWARAAAMKRSSTFRCAQQKVACAEVELVHAGNEHAQQQWRHAKPYVQIAEDLLGEAEELAGNCFPPQPVAAPVAIVPPVLPAPAPAPAKTISLVELSAHVHFNFDRHGAADMRPFSVVQLEGLANKVRKEGLMVQSVKLTGHADRLNGTGNDDYNQRLSERRMETVRDTLVKLGIDPAVITTEARGDGQQIEGCEGRFKATAELQECLLPNRRVEVEIRGVSK